MREWSPDEKIMVFTIKEMREISRVLAEAGIEKEVKDRLAGLVMNRYYKDKKLHGLFCEIYNEVGNAIREAIEKQLPSANPFKWLARFFGGDRKEAGHD